MVQVQKRNFLVSVLTAHVRVNGGVIRAACKAKSPALLSLLKGSLFNQFEKEIVGFDGNLTVTL